MKYTVSAKLHHRTTKEGTRAIYATYTYNRETSTFPTGLSVRLENWDSKMKLAVVGSPEALPINSRLQQIQADLLEIAGSLSLPDHETVKRGYADHAATKSKAEFNKYLDLAVHIGEDEQIVQAERKLEADKEHLKRRKESFKPGRKVLVAEGILTQEEEKHAAAVQELADLFIRYAGTGLPIEGQRDNKGKPKVDQGHLKHYKADSYKHVRTMWNQLNEFSRVKNYPLTLQSINLQFYQAFGDYILFDLDNYDNHFGSLIKRLKTFLLWVESVGEKTIHPQLKPRKFKVLTEENEVIILSDDHYGMLADFRSAPECNSVWVKYIDMTLFQCAMGLRHSDMRRATWRLEGSIVDGDDRRILKGTTKKNQSYYMIPIHLNPEWTLGILEKYEFDFNETARSSKHLKNQSMVTEQKFNQTMKLVLQAVGEKYGLFKNKIAIFKKKWGDEYDLGKKYQWEMHSSHDNRRAFITRMFRAGNSEKIISKMVGTKSLPELRKYQQVNEDDVLEVKNRRV